MDLNDIKVFAKENQVPIILDEGLALLEKLIIKHKVKDALEIGTAIGYSALSMASFGVIVDTIERDETMYLKALEHIQHLNQQDYVTVHFADALNFEGIHKTYDLIFIDAAKGQYQKFFDKYQKYLNKTGIIVCDNLSFHNLDKTKVSRSTRQLIEKIEKFKNYLENHKDYQTTFYHDGDGMSVSRLK